MLGIAIRVAQRMGIHSESALAKCTVFEAEMRRRLWWPLMLFDTRISELAFSNTLTLDPTWDCKIPLNVNDTDLRPEMRVPPATRGEPTDAVFTIIRSELGEYIRHTTIHLEFMNPALKPIGKASSIDDLLKLEETIENRYLKFFDQDNPIHFMATCTVRAQLAKYHILGHNLRSSREAATVSALRVLECDTNIMTSPLTKGFVWFNEIYFPFPAYYHVAQDLKRRPISEQAQPAWEIMSDNWEGWFNIHFNYESPIFHHFSKIILQAWEAYEAAEKPSGQALPTPRIVSSIKGALTRITENIHATDVGPLNITADMGANEFPMSMPMPAAYPNHSLPFGMGMQNNYAWMTPEMSSGPDLSGQVRMNQMDWDTFGGWPR